MKIAIVGSRGFPYVYSGYETLVEELATRLSQKGHHVRVYCHRELFRERPPYVNGIELIYIPGLSGKFFSQFTHSLVSSLHVATHRPDAVLFVNSANGPFGLIARIGRVPSVINVDGLEWKRPKWRGLGSHYFRFASFLATRLFDEVITDSDRMAEIYKDSFGCTSRVIAYGADLGYAENPLLIRQFGVMPDEYFLVVGRMIPDNNVDLIVRAYAQTNLTKKLLVLGGVPYKDRYARQVTSIEDDRIIFPGYVRDKNVLKELYCNCYAYVHGHEFGGTNPALLKALGYGCCVAALDTVFNKEVLAGPTHGYFFAKCTDDLKRLLEFLNESPDMVRSKQAVSRDRIAAAYTWEDVVRKYEELLSTLAARV